MIFYCDFFTYRDEERLSESGVEQHPSAVLGLLFFLERGEEGVVVVSALDWSQLIAFRELKRFLRAVVAVAGSATQQ